MDHTNALMARVGILMKRNRERFWDTNDYVVRYSKRFGKPEAALFFRTVGCKHDAAGGCTMCDYSAGPKTSAEYMIDCVRRGMAELPDDLYSVLISPSGSFLDEWEVPRSARRGILALMCASPYPAFAFETRAETLVPESVAECRSSLERRGLKVYVGLESADTWVAKYCINKALSPSVFVGGVSELRQQGVDAVANVLLGAPFLTEREAIVDTLNTVRWAFDNGVSECCLFPTHVKKWTQMEWFYRHGLYEPPSLWSLIEVLRQLDEDQVSSKIEIAWFTSYGAFNVIASPNTCRRCYNEVVEYFSGFANTNDYAFIQNAIDLECSCKDIWREEIENRNNSTQNRITRAAHCYEVIARGLLGDDWWDRHSERLLNMLHKDAILPG